MNRRIVAGAVAGIAAVALAISGATYSAPVVSADVAPSTLGVGVLQLDLSGGSASAALAFDDLMPGSTTRQLFWVATNDAMSVTAATLSATFEQLVDVAAPCDVSNGKVLGEQESGIDGCTVADGAISGTPQQGNLSRMIAVDIEYGENAGGPTGCASSSGGTSLLGDASPGNVRAIASTGQTHVLRRDGVPLELPPGEGVCLAVSASWPPDATAASAANPEHPTDNAAQGDTFSVTVRFDLTQVSS